MNTPEGTKELYLNSQNPFYSFGGYLFTEDRVAGFMTFAYYFNNSEDFMEIIGTLHPTEYKDPISLSSKITSLVAILNRSDIGKKGDQIIIKWLKEAFLRYDIKLKKSVEKSEPTVFSSLDEVLSKHGYALFNM